MRIYDPFGGYKLANGIAIFHVALLFGQMVTYFYDKNELLDEDNAPLFQAFVTLRNAHFIVFLLSIFIFWTDLDREMNEEQLKIFVEKKMALKEFEDR